MNLIVTEKIYEFIIQFKKDNDGCAPSRDEIASAVGLRSKSDIGDHLDELEKQGLIIQPKTGVKARLIYVVGGRWDIEVKWRPSTVEELRDFEPKVGEEP